MMLGAFLGGMGFGAATIIPVMLVSGVCIGVVNGLLRITFNISSFIATLGVGIALSGVTQGMSGGSVLYSGIPPILTAVGQHEFFGFKISVWLTIALAAILVLVLEHTPFGRQLYAIGGSERVALLAGIRVNLSRVSAFAGAGLLVGVAALFELGQSGEPTRAVGSELLLPAYAAAFLGVTTYRPGYFNIPGAVIAIVLRRLVSMVSICWGALRLQPIFNGVVFILAVITAAAEGRHFEIAQPLRRRTATLTVWVGAVMIKRWKVRPEHSNWEISATTIRLDVSTSLRLNAGAKPPRR